MTTPSSHPYLLYLPVPKASPPQRRRKILQEQSGNGLVRRSTRVWSQYSYPAPQYFILTFRRYYERSMVLFWVGSRLVSMEKYE